MTTSARRRVRPHRLLAGVAAVLLCTGCGSDSGAAYRESAAASLEASLSDARTAELAGRLWLEGSSTHAASTVVVAGSDEGLGSEAAWFEGREPLSPAEDRLRDETTAALDDVADAVQRVRIALARSDREATTSALDALRTASAAVEALAEELA